MTSTLKRNKGRSWKDASGTCWLLPASSDDVQHAIETVREHPRIGEEIAYGFRRVLTRRFPFTIVCAVEPAKSLLSPWRIKAVVRTIGRGACDC